MNDMSVQPRYYRPTDVVIGTIIAVVMGVAFTVFSQGLSLVLTFVPGVLFSYALFLMLRRSHPSRSLSDVAPLYFLALAVQFLHLAEEYVTGFPETFPVAYGGDPIPRWTFVTFNMAAYSVFTFSAVCFFFWNIKVLLMPMLFFVVYGTWGNAVSHTTWCLMSGQYFPGAISALPYFILGPLLIRRFEPHAGRATVFLAIFTITLLAAALYGFSSPVDAQ
jgi:hypothetical protein